MEITRLFDIIYYQLKVNPKVDAFATKYNGVWKRETTLSFINQVNKLSRGLLKLGIKKGDKIALVTTNNRTEWHVVDYACQQVGAITVPIYPSISNQDTVFVLSDSQVKFCFASDKNLFTKIFYSHR